MRLPASLKEVLVSENEALKKGLRLPTIPRKPSVMEILNQYMEECRVPNQDVNIEERVCNLLEARGQRRAAKYEIILRKGPL